MMVHEQDVFLSPAEEVAVAEFLSGVRALLGEKLREVRLFGSRSRGEGSPDSDVDLAVILKPDDRSLRYGIYDLAFDVGLRHGVDLAPLVISEVRLEELRGRERRIARELDRDGVPL